MNSKHIALLILLPLHLMAMETNNNSTLNTLPSTESITLVSNEGTEHPVPSTALLFSNMLNASVTHGMKEKSTKQVLLKEYDKETTQAIADLLIALENKNTSAFFDLIEQLTPESNNNNDNETSFKQLLEWLQFNNKGYQAIASQLQNALENPKIAANLNSQQITFAANLLPQELHKAVTKELVPLLDSTALYAVSTITQPSAQLDNHSAVTCTITTDNLLIAGSANGTITFWDLAARGDNVLPIATLQGHDSWVKCLVINGNLLISGSADKTIKFWDLAARGNNVQPIATLQGHDGWIRCLVIKDNLLISGSDGTIKFWDLAARGNNVQPIATLQGHNDWIRCLVIKDNLLISGSDDGTIKFWDLAARSNNVQPIATLQGHDGWIRCLVIKDNLLISGSDGTIKFWDLAARGNNVQPIATLQGHNDWIRCLVIKDNLLISGSDGTIKFWDLAARGNNAQPIATLQGHNDWVRCLVIKDNLLISGSDDKIIKFWDISARGNNAQPIATLQGYNDWVNCLVIKDNLLISGSGDKTIKFWDLSSYTNLKKYFAERLTFTELYTVQIINTARESGIKITLNKIQKNTLAQLITKLQHHFGIQIATAVLNQLQKIL